MEYLYALKNDSYAPYVIKIGKTSQRPELRAKQIYWGATGVPEHFKFVYVIEVPDCSTAERVVHQTLASYRHNKRREFFHLTIDVVKNVIMDICTSLFGENNIRIVIDVDDMVVLRDDVPFDDHNCLSSRDIPDHSVKSSPLGTSNLSPEQIIRAHVISIIMNEFLPLESETWEESFTRDTNPEKEIEIWEHIAKVFMRIRTLDHVSDPYKKQVLGILLVRSTTTSRNVLKRRTKADRKILNNKAAKEILNAYELEPRPVVLS